MTIERGRRHRWRCRRKLLSAKTRNKITWGSTCRSRRMMRRAARKRSKRSRRRRKCPFTVSRGWRWKNKWRRGWRGARMRSSRRKSQSLTENDKHGERDGIIMDGEEKGSVLLLCFLLSSSYCFFHDGDVTLLLFSVFQDQFLWRILPFSWVPHLPSHDVEEDVICFRQQQVASDRSTVLFQFLFLCLVLLPFFRSPSVCEWASAFSVSWSPSSRSDCGEGWASSVSVSSTVSDAILTSFAFFSFFSFHLSFSSWSPSVVVKSEWGNDENDDEEEVEFLSLSRSLLEGEDESSASASFLPFLALCCTDCCAWNRTTARGDGREEAKEEEAKWTGEETEAGRVGEDRAGVTEEVEGESGGGGVSGRTGGKEGTHTFSVASSEAEGERGRRCGGG